MTDEPLVEIPGAAALIERFGRWPSFHDAEVTELSLRRERSSEITIHVFRMTSEVTPTGHFVTELHTLVTFALDEIVAMELYDFNHQNVLSDLEVNKREDGIELLLGSCYGLAGTIRAKNISLTFVEGLPTNSVYSK